MHHGKIIDITCSGNYSFELSLSSLPDTTNFVITPSPLTVAVEQGTATFQCQHPLADVITWRVNGIPLNMAAFSSVSTASVVTPNGVTTILSIGTLLDNNGTTIECIALIIDESSLQFTAPVVLLIQGTKIMNAQECKTLTATRMHDSCMHVDL